MGLRETLHGGVANIFEALGDLKVDCIIHGSASSYDATTGVVTKARSTTTIKVVRTEFTQKEKVEIANIKTGDLRVLAKGADTPEPNLVDYLEIGGRKYDLIGISTDPVSAMYELHIRAKV